MTLDLPSVFVGTIVGSLITVSIGVGALFAVLTASVNSLKDEIDYSLQNQNN